MACIDKNPDVISLLVSRGAIIDDRCHHDGSFLSARDVSSGLDYRALVVKGAIERGLEMQNDRSRAFCQHLISSFRTVCKVHLSLDMVLKICDFAGPLPSRVAFPEVEGGD